MLIKLIIGLLEPHHSPIREPKYLRQEDDISPLFSHNISILGHLIVKIYGQENITHKTNWL